MDFTKRGASRTRILLAAAGLSFTVISAGCAPDDAGVNEDAGGSTGGGLDGAIPHDGSLQDGSMTGGEDASTTSDLDSGSGDGGNADASTGEDAGGGSSFPTLDDYRICRTDTDCPVRLGECVTELTFNRTGAGSGSSSVKVSDLFDGLSNGEGVCSRSCVTDTTACDTLTLRDPLGAPVPFVCQVVAVGDAIYPEAPGAYPFDDAIDFDEMAAGPVFAALCRPPFELDDAYDDNFCGSCTGSEDCDTGVCWRFDTQAPAGASEPGLCLTPVPEGSPCPMGFEATELMNGATSLGEHCVPVTESCGPCVDRDGDGFGAGHCARDEVDCDDTNDSAYYDPLDMDHAFPAHCGTHDYNCNGLSDEAEQVGVEEWKAFHCEYCGDDYDGKTVQQGTAAQAVLACVKGSLGVASCATAGQVHCVGDPRTTGCEATAAAGGAVYYRDADGDDYGDKDITSLGCPTGAPDGYVANDTDCNDDNFNVHPGVLDLCDCWGDCASEGARVDADCDGAFDEDVTGHAWFVDGDNDGAGGAAYDGNAYCGAPAPNTVLGSGDCADGAATAYGSHLRLTTAAGIPLALPVTSAPPRDASGELYTISIGARAEVCDGLNNDCDGAIDEGVTTTYYYDSDGDGYGDSNAPVDACSLPDGYSANSNDCNDDEGGIHPGATEVCDGVDQNCVDGVDENVALGGACDTGLSGLCSAGTQTACSAAKYTCTQNEAAQFFDDPSPSTPEDEDCDGPETAIYVSGTTGIDSALRGLTPGTAVRTVQYGIDRALAEGATQVYVQSGVYMITSTIELAAGVDVVGGFADAGGGMWEWNGSPTTISHDGTHVTGTRAKYAIGVLANNAAMTLAHLKIDVAAKDTPGVDHYGLAVHDTDGLQLVDVSISVASGTDGEDGDDTPASSPGGDASGSFGGEVAASCDPGTGAPDGGRGGGSVGLPGGGTSPGAGSSAGGSPSPGGPALVAAAGGNAGVRSVQSYWLAVPSEQYPGNGAMGSGGGGGSHPSGDPNTGGGGGAGGCPGLAGQNATHGGSSFGVFVIDSSVTYDSVDISFGGGGDGGTGGRGGAGGDGGDGAPGINGASSGAGGSGGSGGGSGGGGYGGHAMGVFHQGDSDACSGSALSSVTFTPMGVAGVAGQGAYFGLAGLSGNGAESSAEGKRGADGLDGETAACFWSRPCSSDGDCTDGYGYCASGRCY